nr:MAG: hypothetical protein [Bacteriophage sp.]
MVHGLHRLVGLPEDAHHVPVCAVGRVGRHAVLLRRDRQLAHVLLELVRHRHELVDRRRQGGHGDPREHALHLVAERLYVRAGPVGTGLRALVQALLQAVAGGVAG